MSDLRFEAWWDSEGPAGSAGACKQVALTAWQQSRKQALADASSAVQDNMVINPWNGTGMIINKHLEAASKDIKGL